MTDAANLHCWTRRERYALLFCVFVFGLWAMSQGQSNNWDLRNYHWYNGWAWLNGRGALDLAAAQAQSWFNPLLPAALYLLLSSLKPWLGTFLLGCLQGLNLLPLHRIALQLLPAPWLQQRRWLALLIALVGATGATQRGELGATFGDNLVSLPLLGALALLLGAPARDWRRPVLAGLLLGLAVGLKLTAAPMAAGIVLAAPLLAADGTARLRLFVCVATAALASFLLVHGHWMLELYRQFGNPLFPMFGNFFGGDFTPPFELRDDRWLPRTAWQWLFYPLAWANNPRHVSELWFLDLRIPLLFLAVLALPLWWRRARDQSPRPQGLRFLLAAVAVGYGLWLLLFGYYRYLVLLEMLAPLLLTLALLTLRSRLLLPALCTAVVLLGLATRPPRWGRTAHYAEHYVEVQLPPHADYAQAMIVFGGGEPLSFIAPSFPSSARFVRIAGNLVGPPQPEWALDRAARKHLQQHAGPLYLVALELDSEFLREALLRQQLAIVAGSCAPIDSNLFRKERLPQLCALQRMPKA
ncbi:hypothetical protein DFR29_104259 [Tahibacter aquaticus]|uniref:DUF2029 domain-containing protein n=1 Tax=Tahibacter aquaticus TaxID=520092 RepID=A0A4R6Z2X3_9GAMM|nr:hypothetical protein [Tahibacter aquaticus]TDR45829.1 hypothetical protein DFR29_104259 [Tahibacter aquaticus]